MFCNSKSYIHVYPTKFTFVKIKSRRNFEEFIRFFLKLAQLSKLFPILPASCMQKLGIFGAR
jgi:hypothetical protein